MIKRFSLDQLLARTGGGFIIIVLAASQLIALLGSVPGILSIQVNAQFDQNETRIFSFLVPALTILSNALLLLIGWWFTPAARKRLNEWAANRLKPNQEEELNAWR